MHRLRSTWLLAAPRERVWDAIVHTASWPRWWPHVLAVDTLDEGDASGRGAVRRLLWRTALPYVIRIEVEVEDCAAPARLVARARGELAGSGCWSLSEHDGATEVVYRWEVAARRPLLRVLSMLLAPVVRWNHARVMRAGAHGIARHLGCRLLAVDDGPAGAP